MRPVRFGLLFAAVAALSSPLPAQAANDAGLGRQWGMRIIGAEAAWTIGLGAGTTIAIVDTGVDADHEDLRGKVLAGRNFVDPGKPPHDDHGHGTHVAGIAAALTDNRVGVTGVAPDARILPVKVLAADGTGTTRNVLDGIKWAADNRAEVINVSLGVDYRVAGMNIAATATEFHSAVTYAWRQGSIVVVAAGNDASAVNVFAHQPVIVVTATDDADRKAPYATNVGIAQWALAAPGGSGAGPEERNVLSTYWARGVSSAYAWAAGTSMAAPHVAGAAAILRERRLDKEQTVARLRATAKDLGEPGHDEVYGDGRLDVARAVRGLSPAPRTIAPAAATTPTTRAGQAAAPKTTLPPSAARPTGPAAGAVPGLDVAPFDSNGPAPGGTDLLLGGEEAGGRRGDGDGPGDGDQRPWVPVAVGAGLLAAAAAGIVRARRA